MDFKSFLNDSKLGYALKMVLLAGIAIILLSVLAMTWLRIYTHHGDEVVTPDLVNSTVEEASVLAEAEGLRLEVVDTVYKRNAKLGAIIEQRPISGSNTKRGRTVYVTVNAKVKRMIPLPNLLDISYRQAEATLRVMGLEVDNIIRQPGRFKDLVLDVKYNGNSIKQGTRLPEGSKVTLVLSIGSQNGTAEVPDLTGKDKMQARVLLLQNNLTLGRVDYYEEMTEGAQFVVYQQEPAAGEELKEGSSVNIWMAIDTEAAKAAKAQEGHFEDEFFD